MNAAYYWNVVTRVRRQTAQEANNQHTTNTERTWGLLLATGANSSSNERGNIISKHHSLSLLLNSPMRRYEDTSRLAFARSMADEIIANGSTDEEELRLRMELNRLAKEEYEMAVRLLVDLNPITANNTPYHCSALIRTVCTPA